MKIGVFIINVKIDPTINISVPIINKFFLPVFLTKIRRERPEITDPKFITELAKLKYNIYSFTFQ